MTELQWTKGKFRKVRRGSGDFIVAQCPELGHEKRVAEVYGYTPDEFEANAALLRGSKELAEAGQVLADALAKTGFPMSDVAWENAGDDAPTEHQACVEYRALHRAAVAFRKALENSGAVSDAG